MTTLPAQKMKNQQKKKLVFGLGQTGFSCVRYLVRKGFDVIVFDTRKTPPALKDIQAEFPSVKIFLGAIDESILEDVDQVITSPGISLQTPLLQAAASRNIDIVGDIELFAKRAKASIISITGSNGKSSTTTLITDMIREDGKVVRMGGNIGVPALDLLSEDEPNFYVLELSSFQLETTHSLHSKVAIVLNISEDHMDRYDDLAHYANSKLAVYRNAKHKVINLDDCWLKENVSDLSEYIGYSTKTPDEFQYGLIEEEGQFWISYGKEKIFNTADLKIQGKHQISNAVAAVAIGDACGLSREAMTDVLKKFTGLRHRTQFVASINGVTYVNDSKGTNVGATVAAIKGLQGPIVLIAGGEGKGADFSGLREAIENKVTHAVLIGAAADQIKQNIDDLVPVMQAASMEEAVQQAALVAKSGDFVLLSPACASFDMFDNYQHRGDKFMEAVNEVQYYGR